MGANMGAMPSLEDLMKLMALGPALKMLAALETIQKAMGPNLMFPGAATSLGAALAPLTASGLGAVMGSLNAAASGAAAGSVSAGASAAIAASAKAAAAAAASGNLGASASAGVSATASASAAVQLSAAASLAGQAPTMSPSAMNMVMLAMLMKSLKGLGLDLMAFAPCNTK